MKQLGIVILGIMITTTTLGIAGPDRAEPDYWIVFGSFRGGDFSGSIHAIRPDGLDERELSLHHSGRPASLDPWSAPDESLIMFTRGGGGRHHSEVWSLDPHKAVETKLSPKVMVRFKNGRAWPSARPGHKGVFSYVREIGGERKLALARIGDSSADDLGPGEFPNWSPDGNRLAYVREGTIWIQTPGTDDARPVGGSLTAMAYPSWSPQGETLLVTGNDGAGWDLYEIETDGTVLRQLTDTPDVTETAAAWSPDRSLIAYSAKSSNSANGWQRSIYVLDTETGRSHQITSRQFNDTRPTWSVKSSF